MADDHGEIAESDPAGRRFALLALLRLAGAAMVAGGLIAQARGAISMPVALAFSFTGVLLFSVVPLRLARRWKSPASRQDEGTR